MWVGVERGVVLKKTVHELCSFSTRGALHCTSKDVNRVRSLMSQKP